MTIKDHPRRLFEEISVAWANDTDKMAFSEWTEKSGQPLPDIPPGTTNPDDVTTRWEWETDLSEEEEALFDKYVMLATQGREEVDSDAIQPHIDILKLYRNSTPPTTDEQKDTAIRAIIEYLIIDRKED